MARPPSRRPGINRKAQYSLFASYVVAVVGAVAGLLLVVIAIFDPTGFAGLRTVTAEVTRPISVGLKNMVSGISSVDEVLAAYWRAGSQNVALRRQVEADRNRIIEARAIAQENARLKRLLKLVDEDQSDLLTARLISSSSGSTRRFARLNAGRWQGVRPGMPVRAAEGLVGRIDSTTPNTSEVLLLTDTGNIVPVRRANDSVPAISTGVFGYPLRDAAAVAMKTVADTLADLNSVRLVRFVLFSDQDLSIFDEALKLEPDLSGR